MNLTIQDISKETAPIIIRELEHQTEEIILIINSFGGSVSWGLKIYEAIRNARYPVTGLVMVEAASIAVLILQACAERCIHANAKIIFHDIVIKKPVADRTAADLKNAEEKKSAVIERIFNRTQIAREEIRRFIQSEKRFTAREALACGLVDRVYETPPVSLTA